MRQRRGEKARGGEQDALVAALDAAYSGNTGAAACVLFRDFSAATPVATRIARTRLVAPYVPGRFFERELPLLLAVLRRVTTPLRTVIVDGYVTLGLAGEPGLGARLHAALGGRVPVIGVAKSAYRGASWAVPVMRGRSRKPLYVTAAGLEADAAARAILAMHGDDRVPTLIVRADVLAREALRTLE